MKIQLSMPKHKEAKGGCTELQHTTGDIFETCINVTYTYYPGRKM